jgi:hypothetical protein
MECEKSKQPKNNQNRGNYAKRAFFSSLVGARLSTTSFFRTSLMPLRVRKKTVQTPR